MYYIKLFLFLLPYFLTGVSVSIIAILIEKAMIYAGWTPGNPVLTFCFTFISTFLFQFAKFPGPISIDLYMIGGLFIGVFGSNRLELSTTMQKGRWWWKSKSKEQK
ncbi:MAG: hypothetical protein IPL17_22710 [Anaerolineales bacterium]|nr:hypothetical protein [Anaerolineales bacterium]